MVASIIFPALIPAGVSGYTITNALLFEDGDTAYLSRTPSGAGNRKIWTLSFWLKRANLGAAAGEMRIFGGNANASHIYITDGDLLHWDLANDGASLNSGRLETTAVLRDTAWYNIVCSLNTTASIANDDRMRMWINGSEVSSFGARSNPGDDYATNAINDTTLHTIGYRHDDQGSPGMEFDGYLAEIIFVDGTAVTDAAKFGELNSNNIWVPITPDHTFGTNGFYLNFSNANLIGQTANSGSFSENLRTLGTNLGSIGTDAGHPNQAAAFNGTTIVAEASCARDNNATTGATIGKDWGSGNTNTITAFRVYGPTDDGFIDNTKAATIKLQGSTDNFSSSVVDLHTTASISDATNSIHSVTSGITTSTAYRYHRIIMFATDGSSNAAKVAEVEFYRAGSLSLNNWSTNNLVAADQVEDSPTNDADNNVGNYNIWNLGFTGGSTNSGQAVRDGGLETDVVLSPNQVTTRASSISLSSDIWYWEVEWEAGASGGASAIVLIIDSYNQEFADQDPGGTNGGRSTGTDGWQYRSTGQFSWNAGTSVTLSSYAVGDVIGCLLDLTNDRVYVSKNGSWEDGSGGSASSSTVLTEIQNTTNTSYSVTGPTGNMASKSWLIGCTNYHSGTMTFIADFGQKGYAYTAPTNSKKIHTANLPEPTITKPTDYFAPIIYTGNATDDTAIAVGFQPDFTLIKNTSQTDGWKVIDSLRGATKNLAIEAVVENTEAAGLKAFTSTGFTLGTGADGYNDNTESFVSFNWKAGGAPTADNSEAAGAAPTSGSVMVDGSANTANLVGTKAALRISANTESGFAIVRWDSSANSAVTIDHKLGKVPKMYWVKAVDQDYGWYVYCEGIGNTHFLLLKDNNAAADQAYWNDATPTTTVFSVSSAGALEGVNHTGKDFIAYLWAEVEGFSKIGTYAANANANGPFVYCGFKPATIIIKEHDGTGEWRTYNNKIDGYNPTDKYLRLSTNEGNNTGGDIDCLSNGFKIRNTAGEANESSKNYIFAAWAESPFALNNRAR